VWARDGLPVFVSGDLPHYRVPQGPERDGSVRSAVARKLGKFVDRGYLSAGSVSSLVSFFSVPKGEADVRVVFDGTKSGLNNSLWSPTFILPTVDSVLPMLEPGSWQADIDVSEMFYNYMLDPAIRPFCGVDVQPYLGSSHLRLPWLLWTRCVMGLKPSPYGCTRMQLLAEERIRGDMTQPGNPFYFDQIRLNLPGDPSYDPRLPKISKVDSRGGTIAGDFATYVDDLRPVGSTQRHCLAVSRRIGTVLCFLGVQDALRKRSAPSLRAGAWAGSVIHTDQDAVSVSVTQEKWERAREYLVDIRSILDSGGVFDFKTLEKQRGFLVYVTRTYPALVPFLKGIHLTMDNWRGNRDPEGWKLMGELAAHQSTPAVSYANHPATVSAVPRLKGDIDNLLFLFDAPHPPRRVIRSTRLIAVFYGYGDASGQGFGSTFTDPQGLEYTYGIWGDDLVGCSSNFRELYNQTESLLDKVSKLKFPHLHQLVESLERQVTLQPESEIYLFTDNAVAEGAFFRGTSSNKLLFQLIVRLKHLELHQGVQLHMIHVSGRRMQAQGTDSLSRGDLATGVMRNQDMLSFIPLHLSAAERSPQLLTWCQSWLPASLTLLPLSPNTWFTLGHGHGPQGELLDGLWAPVTVAAISYAYLWTPPPAVADVAVEQLAYSRHKRPEIVHIFICPRLMTHRWRKRLFKLSDLVFNVPAGCRDGIWPASMFEPLVVGLILPFLSAPPWLRRNTPPILDLAGQLRGVCSSPQGHFRDLLCQLW
jgi:hypothetical protein